MMSYSVSVFLFFIVTVPNWSHDVSENNFLLQEDEDGNCI